MFVMLPCVMEFENPQNLGAVAFSPLSLLKNAQNSRLICPKFSLDFIVEQMLYWNAFVRRERRFVQRLDLRKPGGISCDIEKLEHLQKE
ncbi:hypothetical protein [Fibrobacter succinogenes]|uniref:hypothetical protein n=1 Tax=Fibrobacter succinogenes TaxID=833 RepID=UPI0026EC5640|nr:hypothetical protein [Fibrobacter succinogenes]